MEHLLYTLGNQTYAMPIERVESIEKMVPITPIPLQSSEQLGVAVVRKTLYTVLDTVKLMGMETSYGEEDMLILVEGKRAFRVTEAKDIVRMEENEIQQALDRDIWLHDGKAIPMVNLTELGVPQAVMA